MQIFAAAFGAFTPKVSSAVIGPACPYFVKSGYMVRRVGKTSAMYVRNESDELMLHIDERHYTVCAVFLHGTVQDILGFGKVVDAGVISPTVGSEDEGGYIVKLSVGGGALGVTGTVRCTTPGKVTFQWTILVLHVLCAPSPETVEEILTVELDGNH